MAVPLTMAGRIAWPRKLIVEPAPTAQNEHSIPMTSVVLVHHNASGRVWWRSELDAMDLVVLAELLNCSNLVQEVARCAPDLVLVDAPQPDDALFSIMSTLSAASACTLVVVSSDPLPPWASLAVKAGVHGYVVQDQGVLHLQAVVAQARARQQREQGLLDRLDDVSQRLEERKAVERAKGILMQARSVSDEEAFQMLRNASMHANLRLGQVSQHIIQSAHLAEALNRAGQLRMLSQRAIKLHLLRLAEPRDKAHKTQLDDTVQRVASNLAWLGKNLSAGHPAELLPGLNGTWRSLQAALQSRPSPDQLASADALAEVLLTDAERLTASLEVSGQLASLRVLNVAGRQRMLSQRFAKLMVLQLLGLDGQSADPLADRHAVQAEFERAQSYLNALPLSTAEIRLALEETGVCWQQVLSLVPVGERRPAGRDLGVQLGVVAQNSEVLLTGFEQLSTHYERSMQMLMG